MVSEVWSSWCSWAEAALFLNEIRISPGQQCQTLWWTFRQAAERTVCICVCERECKIITMLQVKDKEICQIPHWRGCRHFSLVIIIIHTCICNPCFWYECLRGYWIFVCLTEMIFFHHPTDYTFISLFGQQKKPYNFSQVENYVFHQKYCEAHMQCQRAT